MVACNVVFAFGEFLFHRYLLHIDSIKWLGKLCYAHRDASAGAGLVRVTGSVNVPFLGNVVSASAQDVGYNVGAGVYLLPSPNFGFRADLRRFQTGAVSWEDIVNLGDLPLPKFDFWRATVGVTLKF